MTYMYKGKLYTRRGYPVSAYDNTLANTNLNNKQARFYYDALNRALVVISLTSTSKIIKTSQVLQV